MDPFSPELRASILAWVVKVRAVTDGFRALALAKVEEIVSTPGASAAADEAEVGFADPDPVVRAEWEGIDKLSPFEWPRFASRRAVLVRELVRQREMQARGAEANRERRSEAEARRAQHRSAAAALRAAKPGVSDAQISRAIYAALPADERQDQSPETIRKNIRMVGKAL